MSSVLVMATLLLALADDAVAATSREIDRTFGTHGTFTAPFADPVETIALQGDDGFLVLDEGVLSRFGRNGEPDVSFPRVDVGKRFEDDVGCASRAEGGRCLADTVYVQSGSQGRILIGGSLGFFDCFHDGCFIGGPLRVAIVRLLRDGSFDETFGANGLVVIPGVADERPVFALDSEDRILVRLSNRVLRLTSFGDLDVSFADAGTLSVECNMSPLFPQLGGLIVQPDGRVLAECRDVTGTMRSFSRRYDVDGSLDVTFNQVTDGFLEALLPDGGILVRTAYGSARQYFRLGRLDSSGSLDPKFHDGLSSRRRPYFAAVPRPDGRILSVLSASCRRNWLRTHIARLERNGRIDRTFGHRGFVSIPLDHSCSAKSGGATFATFERALLQSDERQLVFWNINPSASGCTRLCISGRVELDAVRLLP